MKKVYYLIFLFSVILSGCNLMEDNATHLAFTLKKGARHLRKSKQTEDTINYQPLTGIDKPYFVEINPTIPPIKPDTILYGSGIRIGGQNTEMTFTSYHHRFVFVPQRLFVEKKNSSTRIVLRKKGNRIDVVELY